ncbi:MAG: histidine phosphatase family protein [Treponema sp.]|nr:histidine phosphatase family protein [Treponema sp.]
MRHGESEGNAAGILQGRGEYSLSPTGRGQVRGKAKILAKMIAQIPVEERMLFSSPQRRARETAELVSERCSFFDTVVLQDLQEMHLGEWTGKTWESVAAGANGVDNNGAGGNTADAAVNSAIAGGDAWDSFRVKSWDAVPGAESSRELFDRALRVWEQMRDRAVAGKASLALTVSHGGLIQWLIKSTLDCRTWFPLFPVHNCGLFVFRAEPVRSGETLTAWDLIGG